MHIVVVPKRHVASILEVESDLLIEIFDVIKEVAARVFEEYGAARVLATS